MKQLTSTNTSTPRDTRTGQKILKSTRNMCSSDTTLNASKGASCNLYWGQREGRISVVFALHYSPAGRAPLGKVLNALASAASALTP